MSEGRAVKDTSNESQQLYGIILSQYLRKNSF